MNPNEKTKYYNQFRKEWKTQITYAKGVVGKLIAYEPFCDGLSKLAPFVSADQFEMNMKDWCTLPAQFDHPLDKEFFKPWWMPIQSVDLDLFVDLSSKHLPIFEIHFNMIEPARWCRNFIFPKADELLMAIEMGYRMDFKLIYETNRKNFRETILSNHPNNSKPFDYYNKCKLLNFNFFTDRHKAFSKFELNIIKNTKENKLQFWQHHFDWFISYISELYPLTKFQLIQYEELLDWDRISVNQFIRWDDAMRKCFYDRLESAVNEDIGRRRILYEDDEEEGWIYIYVNYHKAEEVYFRDAEHSSNEQVYWKDINFGAFKKIEYDEEPILALIDAFDCVIKPRGYPTGELPLPNAIFNENAEANDWKFLSSYCGLKWSFSLLQKYENYWVTEELINNHSVFNYCLKDDMNDHFLEAVMDRLPQKGYV